MRTNFLRAPAWQPHLLHLNRTQHPGAAQYEFTYHLSSCHTTRQHCGEHPMTKQKQKQKLPCGPFLWKWRQARWCFHSRVWDNTNNWSPLMSSHTSSHVLAPSWGPLGCQVLFKMLEVGGHPRIFLSPTSVITLLPSTDTVQPINTQNHGSSHITRYPLFLVHC